MKSLWNDKEAQSFLQDPLQLRVYTSRLLGKEADLVLHGGGNTSVKITEKNLFEEEEDILYVKGSGWDLATIEKEGFAPVRMEALLKMAELNELSDTDMVKYQRAAMTDPYAPNPSIEAILHAVIPFKYVDHTHADAVVTITNTPDGEGKIREIYGDRVIVIPYVMPGFLLARYIYEQTKDIDWSKTEGMILLNHGVFTFDTDARKSYEKMIALVTEAENYLTDKGAVLRDTDKGKAISLLTLAEIRKKVSEARGAATLVKVNDSAEAVAYSNIKDLTEIASRGPVTPDHTIRTKCAGAVLSEEPGPGIEHFIKDYKKYFEKHNDGSKTMLDPSPRWAAWQGKGTLSFGKTPGELQIIEDISIHTMKAIRQAEILDQWKALPHSDLFEMEYWELEQAKLKKAGKNPVLQGKIALVTGAASGIGRACVERLVKEGAVAGALDIDAHIHSMYEQPEILPLTCDVTSSSGLKVAVEKLISHFGGLDIIVSNAGIFPPSESIEEMTAENWEKSLNVNLSSHRNLLSLCIPFLKRGTNPAIVIIASKNVPAPGPGASAYSAAKAALTQLARVAALELGEAGIRVNVIHPNAVYDTGLWTDNVLQSRAASYGMSVEEYKTNNVLKKEVTSADVAELAFLMASPSFSCITGAQVPIDGGNTRII